MHTKFSVSKLRCNLMNQGVHYNQSSVFGCFTKHEKHQLTNLWGEDQSWKHEVFSLEMFTLFSASSFPHVVNYFASGIGARCSDFLLFVKYFTLTFSHSFQYLVFFPSEHFCLLLEPSFYFFVRFLLNGGFILDPLLNNVSHSQNMLSFSFIALIHSL